MCRRSSRFASRNIDTVTPPPSTKIRWQPRARSSRSTLGDVDAGAAVLDAPTIVARPKCVSPAPASDRAQTYSVSARVVVEDAIVVGEPPRRIEDDAQRARPAHVPRRELRIVGRDRAGADDDRVAQRAHAVQVQDVLLAGDVLRFAGVRGDEAVEALAEVADRDRPRDAWRCRSADRDRSARGAGRRPEQDELPAGARAPADDRLAAVARRRPAARPHRPPAESSPRNRPAR